MSSRRFAVLAALLAVTVLCGCVGYFHYHPIKSTEQEKVMEPGAKLFSGETGMAVTPVISAAPVSEESLIK